MSVRDVDEKLLGNRDIKQYLRGIVAGVTMENLGRCDEYRRAVGDLLMRTDGVLKNEVQRLLEQLDIAEIEC